jgi:HD-like signal output (HDOD) protein
MQPRARGKSRNEAGYGSGRAFIASGDDVLLDEEEMVARLLACVEAPDYRPPTLPSVAVELMNLSQRPDVEIDDVVALLEQDSMLTGRILKLAQSPAYGGVQLKSLSDVLMRIGLKTLRDLVMELAMNLKVFRSADYAETMDLLRLHSTVTAHLAKHVCQYSPIDGEFAFMAGLLHDVGIAGTLIALSDGVERGARPPALFAIWPAVDRVHPRAAETMAGHWELPPDIRMAVGAHHQVVTRGHPHPLAAAVALADDLAHECGVGVNPKAAEDAAADEEQDALRSHDQVDRSSPQTLERAREALQLSDEQVALIRREAPEVVERIVGA